MTLRSFTIGLFFFSLAAPAFAVPSLSPRIRDKEIRVGLLTNGYLTKSTQSLSDSGTGNLGLSVGVRGVGHKGNFQFGVEADSLYGLRNANYRYLDISEAYLGFDAKKSGAFTYLGRKRFEWSAMDSYWGLGLYQPRFRWDYLSERENGLFGWFVGYRNEFIQTQAFYSPLFIPEQGAPFDIDAGSCRTSSPWFSCPNATINLFNQSTAVRFSLDIPPVKDLVLNEGYGASIRGGRELGPFARASFVHKPLNQFLLSYEGQLDLSALQIPAIIRPRVLYHDVYSFDAGWNHNRHSVVASAIWERPKRDVTPANWNTQEISNSHLTGLTLKSMPFAGKFRHTRFEMAYFHRNGGNAPDRGPFAQRGIGLFEPRYAFSRAYSFSVVTPILADWARNFLVSTKFILDTVNQGNILQADLYYRPFRRTTLNLGLDMLGSESRSPVDFISRYQRNDRVRAGVSYVF
jgi:hypothetical protein